MKKVITTEQKQAVLQLFVPLCAQSRRYEAMMRDKGFSAFSVIEGFEASFGEQEQHYTFLQELSKETVGSYDSSIASYVGETATGYRSDYLSDLVRQRDEKNGMSFREFQLTNPPVWELELDPCRQAKVKAQFDDPAKFQEQKLRADASLQQHKKTEVGKLINRTYESIIALSESAKFALLKEQLNNYLTPLGFSENKGFSSKQYPVYRAELTNDVSLCCGIKKYDDLVLQNDTGGIELVFHIRSNGFKSGKVEVSPFLKVKGSEYFVILNTMPVIPYFSSSYTRFFSLEEMELNIAAQVTLFESLYMTTKEQMSALF